MDKGTYRVHAPKINWHVAENATDIWGGALLYPMVNDDLKRGLIFPIEGTPIIIKIINLNAVWRDIESDMLDFVHRVEIPYTP